MGKTILLAFLLLGMSGCKKSADAGSDCVSADPEKTSILGKWDLSDRYISPGGGVDIHSIPWTPVEVTNSDYFWFLDDHSARFRIAGTSTTCNYSIHDSSFILTQGSKMVELGYKMIKPHLEIYGNLSFDVHCIEFCGTRYIFANN